MKNLKLILVSAGLVACASAATAQLTKEITIDREIVPEVRAASRPNARPQTISFVGSDIRLGLADPETAVPVDPTLRMLDPARTEPAFPLTPYRGYIDLGYFPTADFGVSAGYSILENKATRLGAWLQFNNLSYKRSLGIELPEPEAEPLPDGKISRLSGKIGVDFSHRIDAGALQASTAFGFGSYNPLHNIIENVIDGVKLRRQTTVDWTLGLCWNGKTPKFDYHAGIGLDLYSFGHEAEYWCDDEGAIDTETLFPAPRQFGGSLDLGISAKAGENGVFGVDLTGNFLNTNHFLDVTRHYALLPDDAVDDAETLELPAGGKSIGLIRFNPYYRYASGIFTAKVGLNLDVTANWGKALHVAPDVMLAVNPASGFGAWLRLKGGEQLNSYRSLMEFCPWFDPYYNYGTSNIPVAGTFGLRFGSFYGATVGLHIDYAAVNNALMPFFDCNALLAAPCNLRGAKAGVELQWRFRKLLSLGVEADFRLTSGDKGYWYEWADRARTVVSAKVEVTPIEPLCICVGYQLRASRSTAIWPVALPAEEPVDAFSLGNSNNLSAGATYAITPALSVFAEFENLLGSDAYEVPLLPQQGFHGLFGVGYKF